MDAAGSRAILPAGNQAPRACAIRPSSAKLIVDIATGEVEDRIDDGRDPAAVERGKRGGIKGGVARAAGLTPERRREIAGAAAAVDGLRSSGTLATRRGQVKPILYRYLAIHLRHAVAKIGHRLAGACDPNEHPNVLDQFL